MPRTSYRDPKPESFWRDLIDRWRASGKSVAAFCAAQHVSQATFYAWRKRLVWRAQASPMARRHTTGSSVGTTGGCWAILVCSKAASSSALVSR